MHLVHKSEDGKSILVLGILFNLGRENEDLEELISAAEKQGKSVVNFSHFLDKSARLCTYEGSLTTPPCTEGVHWVLSYEHPEISLEQVGKYRAQVNETKNNRPIQPVTNSHAKCYLDPKIIHHNQEHNPVRNNSFTTSHSSSDKGQDSNPKTGTHDHHSHNVTQSKMNESLEHPSVQGTESSSTEKHRHNSGHATESKQMKRGHHSGHATEPKPTRNQGHHSGHLAESKPLGNQGYHSNHAAGSNSTEKHEPHSNHGTESKPSENKERPSGHASQSKPKRSEDQHSRHAAGSKHAGIKGCHSGQSVESNSTETHGHHSDLKTGNHSSESHADPTSHGTEAKPTSSRGNHSEHSSGPKSTESNSQHSADENGSKPVERDTNHLDNETESDSAAKHGHHSSNGSEHYSILSGKLNSVDHPEPTPQGTINNAKISGSSGNASCFPGTGQVMLRDGRTTTMADLQIGDEVAIGDNQFSPVYTFSHRDETAVSRHLQINLRSGAQLTLTPGHFVYSNDRVVAASDLSVGDYLKSAEGGLDTVRHISLVTATGLYNPHTISGTIIVDGILCSTYTNAIVSDMAQALLAPLRFLFRIGVFNEATGGRFLASGDSYSMLT